MISTMLDMVVFLFVVLCIYDVVQWLWKGERITMNHIAASAVIATILGFICGIIDWLF